MINTQDKKSLEANRHPVELLTPPGSGPCISIVLALKQELNQRKQNATLIHQGVQAALAALDRFPCSGNTRKDVIERLNDVVAGLMLDKPGKGIGIFVSADVSKSISFPFEVNEVVIIGKSFETRDILYLEQHQKPYYIVSLAKTSIRAFKAEADSVQEVRSNGFPLHYLDDYEYSRSTVASSVGYGMKGFEKDKGTLEALHRKSFVTEAAHHLIKLMGSAEEEIMVCGAPRLATDFVDACMAKNRILVKVEGSHNGADFESMI